MGGGDQNPLRRFNIYPGGNLLNLLGLGNGGAGGGEGGGEGGGYMNWSYGMAANEVISSA